MIWRRWRRCIQLTNGVSLKNHFISWSHYLTEELLAHAGINHQLAIYWSFPHLSIKEYSMRSTGNRGIEAIHGMFRGGTTSLLSPPLIWALQSSWPEWTRQLKFTALSTSFARSRAIPLLHQRKSKKQVHIAVLIPEMSNYMPHTVNQAHFNYLWHSWMKPAMRVTKMQNLPLKISLLKWLQF